MSLMDAFLLDPAPLDVWIAARTDGIVGSGTEEDPFDGTRTGPPSIAVSSITFGATTATVTTSVNHGFSTDDFVLVEGANGPDAGLYNGVFSITYVSATSFSYTMPGTPQSAAVGVLSCQLDPLTVISSLTSTGTMATVTTATDHGFSSGELVLIAGVKGAGATHTDVFLIHGRRALVLTSPAAEP